MMKVVYIWLIQLKRRWMLLGVVFVLAFTTGSLIKSSKAGEQYLYSTWQESAELVDVIIGYKGSPIQIIANALFRLENPTGNISGSTYDFWTKHPLVQNSCALSMGDKINGHPLVGVEDGYYEWFGITLLEGHYPKGPHDLVLAENLATSLGIELGNELQSSHGSDARGEGHAHPLKVVGIIKANRPSDQDCFFTTNEAYLDLHHQSERTYTSLLLRLKSKSAMLMLPATIAKRADEQGAFPVFVFGQIQKQWEPTLLKARKFGTILGIVMALLYLAMMWNIAGNERSTQAYLATLKWTNGKKILAAFGLYSLFGFFGLLLSLQVIENYFPGSIQIIDYGVCLTLWLTSLVIMRLRK